MGLHGPASGAPVPRHRLVVLLLAVSMVGATAGSPAAVAQQPRAESDRLLDRAVRRNDVATLRQLLSQGARPGPETLVRAAGGSTAEVVGMLVDGGGDVNLGYGLGTNPALVNLPLGAAVQGGRAEVVELLLQAGADPDRNHVGIPLASVAAREGDTEILSLLIAAGAGLEVASAMGTPLIHAVMEGHAEAAGVLLAAGADPDADGGSGGRALHWAGRSGDARLVQLLLQAGADPNGTTSTGHTPLMAAAEGGSAAMVDLLLSAGADPDARSNSGAHPLGAAKGVSSVVDRLLAASPEMRANRAAPHAREGGVYGPGVLIGGVCGHRGAIPPDAGCGDSGLEVTTFTSIRSAQMRETIAPPLCAPVRIPFEGTYTVTVTTMENAWVGDRCHRLGRTDGQGRELTYFTEVPSQSSASYTFRVAADAPAAADEEEPECSERCGKDDASWSRQEIEAGAARYREALRDNVQERAGFQREMELWKDYGFDPATRTCADGLAITCLAARAQWATFQDGLDKMAADCARISRRLMQGFPQGCKDFLGCLDDEECEAMCGAVGKGPPAFCYAVHERFHAALPTDGSLLGAYRQLVEQYPCLAQLYRMPMILPGRNEVNNLLKGFTRARQPLSGMARAPE